MKILLTMLLMMVAGTVSAYDRNETRQCVEVVDESSAGMQGYVKIPRPQWYTPSWAYNRGFGRRLEQRQRGYDIVYLPKKAITHCIEVDDLNRH